MNPQPNPKPAGARALRCTTALATLALLAACSSTPPANSDLAAARASVEQARAAAAGARGAGTAEVEQAQRALSLAEAAWADDEDRDETRHLAYLAQRRAEIALAVMRQAGADARVAQAGDERERIRLEARTREAAAAAERERAAREAATAAQGQVQQAQQATDAARQRAQQEAERAAALERDLQELQARNTDRGLVVTLGDVLFATGRATLAPGAQATVQRLAGVLQQHPRRRVRVEGHTDAVGSAESNLALAQRRAEAFAQALVALGVSAERMDVRAFGETQPVADNGTPAGRQQNRRVEVLFSDAEGRFAGG
jgi:outer membrane protein OmpA-like peptidoglycan-associated protein